MLLRARGHWKRVCECEVDTSDDAMAIKYRTVPWAEGQRHSKKILRFLLD